MIDALQDIQSDIYDFLDNANTTLPASDALFYSGSFVTGQVDRPDFLFLGINPGFSRDAWPNRDSTTRRRPFSNEPCKFIQEYADGAPLAKKIVDVLLHGDAGKLASCAETSLRSFFATPDVRVLEGQLAALAPSGLNVEHDRMIKLATKNIIDATSAKNIICVGLTTFQQYLTMFGGSHKDVSMKSVKSASGKSEPVYYKHTIIDGRSVHGLLHLSGAHPSKEMLDNLRQIFAALGLKR